MARPPLTPELIESFRARICDVAFRQVAEFGSEALSWRNLAAELGCSHATPYRYFKDKSALLEALRIHGRLRLEAELETLLADLKGTKERIHGLVSGITSFAETRPEAYRLIFSGETSNAQPFWVVFEAELTPATGSGELEGDPATIAQLIWATLHGLIVLEIARSLARPANELARTAIGALLDQHRPRQTSARSGKADWAVW